MVLNRRQQEEERLTRQFQCPDADSRVRSPTGVLLSDEIQHYVDSLKLIDPFELKNLKPAGYELTVGDEYFIGGEKKELTASGEIRIPPFNVAVIRTKETINLPRFLIARWNIRVKWAYHGLLWVGGPQVDPGWVGNLCCPIYNLSDKEVVLRSTDTIALMDFVTTTPFHAGKSIAYDRPPKRVLLDEYGAEALKSALYTEAKKRIDQVEEKTERFMGAIVVAFTILFAALAVLATRSSLGEPLGSISSALSLVVSVAALAAAILAYRISRGSRGNARAMAIGRRVTLAVASFLLVVGTWWGYNQARKFFQDTNKALLDRQVVQDSLGRNVAELQRTLDSIDAIIRFRSGPVLRSVTPADTAGL